MRSVMHVSTYAHWPKYVGLGDTTLLTVLPWDYMGGVCGLLTCGRNHTPVSSQHVCSSITLQGLQVKLECSRV